MFLLLSVNHQIYCFSYHLLQVVILGRLHAMCCGEDKVVVDESSATEVLPAAVSRRVPDAHHPGPLDSIKAIGFLSQVLMAAAFFCNTQFILSNSAVKT